MTLYRETTCEHGTQDVCDHMPIDDRNGRCLRLDCDVMHDESCLGGSREEVTIDYEAAHLAQHAAWCDCGSVACDEIDTEILMDEIRIIVDAALHTEKETASTA
jgi:hypothetical protein